MPTYVYDRISAYAFKRGSCSVCGKSAERSRMFSQTLNPFNKNADGFVKTSAEIHREVNAEAKAWQDSGNVTHARCENAEATR